MSREAFALPKYFNTNINVDSSPQSAMEYLFQVRKEAELMPSVYSIANNVVQLGKNRIIDRGQRCTWSKRGTGFWCIYPIFILNGIEKWWFWWGLGRECGSRLYSHPKSIWFCKTALLDDRKKEERGCCDVYHIPTCKRWKWLGILLFPEARRERCNWAVKETLQISCSQWFNSTRLCTNCFEFSYE